MAPYAYHHCAHSTTELVILYVILVFITTFYAAMLAFEGEEPYEYMPERYRNRRWVKPFLPIIFIVFPALLWPIVMLATVGMVAVCTCLNNRDEAKTKEDHGNKAKDVEFEQGPHTGLPSAHPSSKLGSRSVHLSRSVVIGCDEFTPLLPKEKRSC